MKDLTSAYLRQKRKRILIRVQHLSPLFLRGSLIETYKRCGKPTCKCQQGKGHGPKYYLSVSFPGRRPQMIYIPRDMKNQVQSYLDNHQATKSMLEEICEINRELVNRRDTF